MNDIEKNSHLNALVQDAQKYSGEWIPANQDLLDRYLCEPYGDEEAGRSSVSLLMYSIPPKVTRLRLRVLSLVACSQCNSSHCRKRRSR